VPLLAAFGVTRLVSSSSVRCADTLRPYAAAAGLPLRLRDGLSEEGYAADPARSAHHLRRILERGTPTALCSHGPVLPTVLESLGAMVDDIADDGPAAARSLSETAADGMGKGEVLVCHVVDTGEAARVIAVERYPT
jgi:8-oxo-(d)GTP phosphatase